MANSFAQMLSIGTNDDRCEEDFVNISKWSIDENIFLANDQMKLVLVHPNDIRGNKIANFKMFFI